MLSVGFQNIQQKLGDRWDFFSLSLEEHTKPNISCYCTEFKADKQPWF